MIASTRKKIKSEKYFKKNACNKKLLSLKNYLH